MYSSSDSHAGAESIKPPTQPPTSGQSARQRRAKTARTPSQTVTNPSRTTV